MHTSSGVDNIDEYLETVTKKGDGFTYRYGTEDRPVTTSKITVPYKTASGMAQKEFTVYQHAPRAGRPRGRRQVGQRPADAGAAQGAARSRTSRTKAKNYKAFKETMELHTNSSNNTIYADADGNIAYFHSNFIPRRDPKFDWTQAGRRQRSRRPSGRACCRSTRRPGC